MTLYDILMTTWYYQPFYVYDENEYGQHICKGVGTRNALLDEDKNPELLNVLCNKVLIICPCKDGSFLVVVKSNHYKNRAEKLYSKEYVAKWDDLDQNTRPWRSTLEMERGCGICDL